MKLNTLKILITLVTRTLTEAEANELRAFIASLKPRVHLVLPDWRWIEAHGLGKQAAHSLLAQVAALGVRFSVAGWRAGSPSLHVSATARGLGRAKAI